MFKSLVLIGAGGFLGSICRYLLTRLTMWYWPASFPFGTFIVNILGCLVIGLLMGFALHHHSISASMRAFWAIGFCGGFTTFSTFSLELFEVYQRGQAGLALTYALASVVLGLLAVGIGFWLTKS
jgi:CrcB protein